jgi:hypothetical protein
MITTATDSLKGRSRLNIPPHNIDEQTLASLDPFYQSVARILISDGHWTVTA